MDTNYAHGHPVGEECHCFDDLNQPVTTASSLPPQGENCCHRCDDHGGTEEHWNGCPCHKETSVKEKLEAGAKDFDERFLPVMKELAEEETPVEGFKELYLEIHALLRCPHMNAKELYDVMEVVRTNLAEERQRGREECADYLEKHVAMEKEHGRHEVAGALFAASCWMREAAKSPREGAEGK